ncbi:hypothetical protein [Phytomonospora endophytica]|uniref:tRNA nuclease CdiA C-terminal domain-containing protein n=1 Tax=Phytomonospora endophytica TaxID=714109 RepID=A0A841FVJ1_9ACTN|nr:hypothetical protein [Phytomonospora endophytica]MBB6037748.1 hypothetical protein [Phytomonospora endophytica]
MTIDEVAGGCHRAIEMIKKGIEEAVAARAKFVTTKSTLAETLTEQSSRYAALTAPYGQADTALEESINAAQEAIETIESYVAFIRGTAGPLTTSATTPRLASALDTQGVQPTDTATTHDADGAGVTRPSLAPDPERLPGGTVSKVREARTEGDGIRRENTAATVLAQAGYDVVQNPPAKENRRQPDYLIENRHWDCLSPLTTNGGQIRKRISEKIKKDQADRIILNLDREDGGSMADPDAIKQSLERRPVAGLKEIKIIANRQVIDFYPW